MTHNFVLQPSDLSTASIKDELILRAQAPDGLFFVLRHLLGFTRLSRRVHGPSCEWLAREIKTPFAFLSYGDARGQGKSSTMYGLPFWAFLQPPDLSTVLRGLDTRFGYVAPKIDLARYHHLSKIRDLFDRSEAYRELTADFLRPRKDSWGLKEGLMFEDASPIGGRNIIPLGMESVSTTRHPPILIVDDPITEQNYRSASEIAKCLDWIDKSYNLVEPERGCRIVTGNEWAIGDVQHTIRTAHLQQGYEHLRGAKVWRRSLVACSVCINGRPPDHTNHNTDIGDDSLIPLMLNIRPPTAEEEEAGQDGPSAEMADVRRTVDSVSRLNALAQYFNDPIAPGDVQFDKRALHFWGWHYTESGEQALLLPISVQEYVAEREAGNPAVGNKRITGSHEILPISAFDVYLLCDPAVSEESSRRHARFAIATVGVEKKGPRIVLLEDYAKNAAPQVNLDAFLDYYLKYRYQYRRSGVESVGYQATIPRAIIDRAKVRGVGGITLESIEKIPRVRAEGAQEDRIKYNLSALFESGNFYCRRDHYIFLGEFDTFGVKGAAHDFLDALSNGPLVWGPTRTGVGSESAKRLAAKQFKRLRGSGVTGYG